MAVSHVTLGRADWSDERAGLVRSEDLTSLSTGSGQNDLIAAILIGVMAYLLLIAQNLGLFAVAFLAFAFFYNPVRLKIGQRTYDRTTDVF